MAKVSIGLPVYNGERYLRDAIDSILAQTVDDFELIVCDNASTDATETICRHYVARDPRIRYYRHDHNLGASRNFNRTVELASGQYFKWAAHDDMLAPEYLARCVEILDRDATVVVSHSHARVVDEDGCRIEDHLYPEGYAASPDPARRFADLLRDDRLNLDIFGVFRAPTLRRTRLVDTYVGSDRILRAHVGLLGRYHIVPELLFLSRDHEERCIRALPAHHLRVEWLDPFRKSRRVFPHWKFVHEYAKLLGVGNLSRAQRRRCRVALLRWLVQDLNWARLGADLVIGCAPSAWRVIASIAPGGRTHRSR
jgi:glycosyltransferase involved in cell wall biosynthesis